jgi:hypothetical protein
MKGLLYKGLDIRPLMLYTGRTLQAIVTYVNNKDLMINKINHQKKKRRTWAITIKRRIAV